MLFPNKSSTSSLYMKSNPKKTGKFQPVVRSIVVHPIYIEIAGISAELEQFKPEDPSNFEIGLEVSVGIEGGGEGADTFQVSVCTPKWILENIKEDDPMIGHGMLIISSYSYDRMVDHIKSYVKMCAGNTIDDVMRRVGFLGEWEYEWEI